MQKHAHKSQDISHETGVRAVWRLLNTPIQVDARGMRIACTIFLVTYTIIALVRYHESHAFFWLRAGVCAYAAFGIWLSRRVTWRSVRGYTIGLALLLPLQAAYIDGMLGNHMPEVGLTALATFAPLVFMQAGLDLAIVVPALAVGHTVVLAIVPTPAVPFPIVAMLLGGAISTGASTSLQSLMYRARWTDSLLRLEEALDASAHDAAISVALARVGRALISSLETPVLLDRVCNLTAEVLGCDFSTTWMRDPDGDAYTAVASYGIAQEQWDAMRLLRMPAQSSPLTEGLLREEIVQVTYDDLRYPVTASLLAYYGSNVALCIALRRGDDLVGVHSAGYRSRATTFTDAQMRIARGIAQLASMALTNATLVEELERASRLKSEFVSTMSHELRTPLNVILGYTDILGDDLHDPEHRTVLGRMRQSSLELLEMIEATLDLNRLAAGRDLPQMEPLALASLWDDLRTEFAALPRTSDVALRWEPVGATVLTTDRRKLKMVVKNLVGNALKFTSSGEIVVACALEADVAALTVRDTGIGIPPEHLPHIFDMFRQVDSSDRRSYGGAGLGLYIVRQLVEQLGGTIDVTSTPGAGSTFTVQLPATPSTTGRSVETAAA